jgi:hypothetical protein
MRRPLSCFVVDIGARDDGRRTVIEFNPDRRSGIL